MFKRGEETFLGGRGQLSYITEGREETTDMVKHKRSGGMHGRGSHAAQSGDGIQEKSHRATVGQRQVELRRRPAKGAAEG